MKIQTECKAIIYAGYILMMKVRHKRPTTRTNGLSQHMMRRKRKKKKESLLRENSAASMSFSKELLVLSLVLSPKNKTCCPSPPRLSPFFFSLSLFGLVYVIYLALLVSTPASQTTHKSLDTIMLYMYIIIIMAIFNEQKDCGRFPQPFNVQSQLFKQKFQTEREKEKSTFRSFPPPPPITSACLLTHDLSSRRQRPLGNATRITKLYTHTHARCCCSFVVFENWLPGDCRLRYDWTKKRTSVGCDECV